MVDLSIHLRADEREQAHPVPFPDHVLSAISHAEGLLLHYLSGDEGGSGEPQRLFQGTSWEHKDAFQIRKLYYSKHVHTLTNLKHGTLELFMLRT